MKKKKEELGIARKRITKPGSEKALIERTKRMLAGSIGGGDMVGPGGGCWRRVGHCPSVWGELVARTSCQRYNPNFRPNMFNIVSPLLDSRFVPFYWPGDRTALCVQDLQDLHFIYCCNIGVYLGTQSLV